MAIKKTVTTPHGIEVANAYHRVEAVSLPDKSSVSFYLRSYKYNSGFPFFSERYVVSKYDINGANPIAQAYAHLKSLPEFADAVDC